MQPFSFFICNIFFYIPALPSQCDMINWKQTYSLDKIDFNFQLAFAREKKNQSNNDFTRLIKIQTKNTDADHIDKDQLEPVPVVLKNGKSFPIASVLWTGSINQQCTNWSNFSTKNHLSREWLIVSVKSIACNTIVSSYLGDEENEINEAMQGKDSGMFLVPLTKWILELLELREQNRHSLIVTVLFILLTCYLKYDTIKDDVDGIRCVLSQWQLI